MQKRRLSKKEMLLVLWASHPRLHEAVEKAQERAERAERECSALKELLNDYRREVEALVKRLAEQPSLMSRAGREDEEEVTLDEIMTEWVEGAKNER